MRRLHRISELLCGRRPAPVRGRRPVGSPGRPGARARGRLVWAACLIGIGACESPRWTAAVSPGDATLQVDGKRRPAASIDEVIPYYGVVAVAGVPRADQQPPRLATRTMLPIDEPVTPWIFPLDFPIELAQVLFAPTAVRRVRIELPRREDVPLLDTTPRELDAFRARAAAATAGR